MLGLREYTSTEVELGEADLRAVVALTRGEGAVLRSVTPTGPGRCALVPGPFVGRLRLPGGLVLDIRSRLDLADTAALLAGYVGAPALLRDDPVPADEHGSLVDLVAVTFVDALERLVGRGLPKGYVERTFTRPPFAGRPDVATHLRRHAGRADRLVTRAQRITRDVPVNQVLARALDLLLRAPLRHARTRARLTAMIPALAAITRVPDVERAIRVARLRLPAHGRDVFDAAVLVIRGTSLLPEGVDRSGAAVLFPMTSVWEAFVERTVAAEAAPGHRVERQVRVPITDPPDASHGRADVVEYDPEGRPVAVYDAKYKPIRSRPDPGDLYQVFTYCRRLRVTRGVLVLPGRGGSTTYAMDDVTVEQRGLPVLVGAAQQQ
ncbi:5-methylcytosine restriction system specificity protein McrC [Actinomycetospora aeridis]|uniref:5-methylcytosine-specific restriction enzyme subunit McrC n=1 Tax=Actinomycetospora aeridis TaxID=3129231 RepID=A0ABU8MZK6_9PSEU